jgi:hypothetical protein
MSRKAIEPIDELTQDAFQNGLEDPFLTSELMLDAAPGNPGASSNPLPCSR